MPNDSPSFFIPSFHKATEKLFIEFSMKFPIKFLMKFLIKFPIKSLTESSSSSQFF